MNRELTNRRLRLDDAVGFSDMPTAHACEGTYPVASRQIGRSYCLKTVGRTASFRCFLLIIKVFLEKLLRGEQIVILEADGATDRRSFPSCGLLRWKAQELKKPNVNTCKDSQRLRYNNKAGTEAPIKPLQTPISSGSCTDLISKFINALAVKTKLNHAFVVCFCV